MKPSVKLSEESKRKLFEIFETEGVRETLARKVDGRLVAQGNEIFTEYTELSLVDLALYASKFEKENHREFKVGTPIKWINDEGQKFYGYVIGGAYHKHMLRVKFNISGFMRYVSKEEVEVVDHGEINAELVKHIRRQSEVAFKAAGRDKPALYVGDVLLLDTDELVMISAQTGENKISPSIALKFLVLTAKVKRLYHHKGVVDFNFGVLPKPTIAVEELVEKVIADNFIE